MAERSSLTGILLVVAVSGAGGCVVYRDRIVTVSTQTQVAFDPGTAAPQGLSREQPSPPVALPDVPQRLEAPAMHAALDDYGTWVESANYGNVWVPQVAEDFVPYGTNGQWEYTSAGWYWESELPWGAVAFHYGRWVQEDGLWGWVPGAVFAPAWVDWRYGGGWVGWSPLAPLGAGYAAPYVYCEANGLLGPSVWNRVVTGSAASSLYPRTAAIGPSYGYGGAQYSWGPPASVMGMPASHVGVPIERAWSITPGALALSSSRSGVPVPGGAGGRVVGHPLGGPRLGEVPTISSVVGPRPSTSIGSGAVERGMVGSNQGGFATGHFGAGAYAPVSAPGTRLRNSVTLGAASYGTPQVGRVATWDRFSATAPRVGGFGGSAPAYAGGHFGPVAPAYSGVQYRSGPAFSGSAPAARPAAGPSYAPSYAPASHMGSFGGGGFGGFHGGGRGGRR